MAEKNTESRNEGFRWESGIRTKTVAEREHEIDITPLLKGDVRDANWTEKEQTIQEDPETEALYQITRVECETQLHSRKI